MNRANVSQAGSLEIGDALAQVELNTSSDVTLIVLVNGDSEAQDRCKPALAGVMSQYQLQGAHIVVILGSNTPEWVAKARLETALIRVAEELRENCTC